MVLWQLKSKIVNLFFDFYESGSIIKRIRIGDNNFKLLGINTDKWSHYMFVVYTQDRAYEIVLTRK